MQARHDIMSRTWCYQIYRNRYLVWLKECTPIQAMQQGVCITQSFKEEITMKRFFTLLLCMAMLLSMAACGSSTKSSGQSEPIREDDGIPAPMPGQQPGEEEIEQINSYRTAVELLMEYADNIDNLWVSSSMFSMQWEYPENMNGGAALGVLQNIILNASAVDRWAGTEWANDTHINWNRMEVLDSLVVVDDGLILSESSCYVDHLGNERIGNTFFWSYDESGMISSHQGSYVSRDEPWAYRSLTERIASNPCCVTVGTPFYVYDENHRLTKIEYRYSKDDEINAVRNFLYEGDILVAEQIIDASGEEDSVTYNYNELGQVSQIVALQGLTTQRIRYTYSYEYGNQDQVLMEKILIEQEDYAEDDFKFYEEITTVYTYDQAGRLVSATCTDKGGYYSPDAETQNTWDIACDDWDRPVRIEITYGETLNAKTGEVLSKPGDASQIVEFTYGTYVIYDPN